MESQTSERSAHTLEHESFHVAMEGSLVWRYHSEHEHTCPRLIDLANLKRWDPARDIDWNLAETGTRFPCARRDDPLQDFAPYEQLPLAQRRAVSWQRHGIEISEILHGEQLAMLASSQLLVMMTEMENKLFAGSQVADEARHISFFLHYLDHIGMPVTPPSPVLSALMKDVLQTDCSEFKMLSCQLLIESLALAQFSHLRNCEVTPALDQGLARILEDEARHVRFGTDFLQKRFALCDAHQRERYGEFVVDQAFALALSDNHCTRIARQHGWVEHELRQHLRLKRQQNPALLRQRFRQLSLNIKAVGLMSASLQRRLQRYQ